MDGINPLPFPPPCFGIWFARSTQPLANAATHRHSWLRHIQKIELVNGAGSTSSCIMLGKYPMLRSTERACSARMHAAIGVDPH